MKNIFYYLFPLLLVFSAMTVVNEYSRLSIGESSVSKSGYTTMNAHNATPDACTWSCYHNTTYCKEHHTQLLKPYFSIIDPLYFGMISALLMTGNYGAANVIFLVILWPLLMSFLLVKTIRMQLQIFKLRKLYA